MKDIRNLNIGKAESEKKGNNQAFMRADVSELNLSVRSFNCLKRAGCDTIRDVYACIGEAGDGLRRIRNLGRRSEMEILENLEKMREEYAKMEPQKSGPAVRTILRPARSVWDREIASFHLSTRAKANLQTCGIIKVRDLYGVARTNEPGWYAVRELFEEIAAAR